MKYVRSCPRARNPEAQPPRQLVIVRVGRGPLGRCLRLQGDYRSAGCAHCLRGAGWGSRPVVHLTGTCALRLVLAALGTSPRHPDACAPFPGGKRNDRGWPPVAQIAAQVAFGDRSTRAAPRSSQRRPPAPKFCGSAGARRPAAAISVPALVTSLLSFTPCIPLSFRAPLRFLPLPEAPAAAGRYAQARRGPD